MAQVTVFENCCHYMQLDLKMVNPTTQKLVCCAGGKDRVSNSCITYILHTISHGTTWCTDFWGLQIKSPNTGQSWIRYRRQIRILAYKMYHFAGMSCTRCQLIHGSLVMCELCTKCTLQPVTDSLFTVMAQDKCWILRA